MSRDPDLYGDDATAERLLRDTDVPVCVPGDSAPQVRAAHLLALHGLCDELDRQLLGDEESMA